MKQIKLKPCPCCGSEVGFIIRDAYWLISCEKCGIEVFVPYSINVRSDATKIWNRTRKIYNKEIEFWGE